MADVLQRALNAGVFPRRVLLGHAHDQLSNFGHDTLAAGVTPRGRPFPGDELSMPAQ